MKSDLPIDGEFGIIPIVESRPETQEHTLLRALLKDAIEVATGLTPIKNKWERIDARRWLESKNNGWVLSCGLVCAFLKIDQDAMFREIRSRFRSERSKVKPELSATRKSSACDPTRTRRGSRSPSLRAR